MAIPKLFTWQKIEKYPDAGKMFGANNTVMNTYESYDRFMHKKVVEYTPLIEQKPLPGISFIRDKIVPFESPDISFVNGELLIDGTLGKRELYTRQSGRYLPGLYGIAGIGVRIPNMNSGVYQFGYGNGEGNRIGVEVNNGELSIFILSGGVLKVSRPRSQWLDPLDGTGPSGITLGPFSKIVLRIEIGWYGYLSIEFKFVISSRQDGDQLVTIDTEGLDDDTSVSIEQPDLPIFAEANGGMMYVGGRQYGVYGRYNPEYRITSMPRITKTIPTTGFVPIISAKIKAGTVWSSVPVLFQKLSVELDNTCEYRVILHDELSGLLTGSTFLAPIDGIPASETALEIDTAATALAAGGYKMYGSLFVSGGVGAGTEGGEADAPDITVPRGLILTVVAQAVTTTANATTILKFKEEF